MSEAYKDHLRLTQAAAWAVMRAGLPLAKNPEALNDEEWERLGGELLGAMLELVSAGTNIRRLPRTTVCVCGVCKRIGLPEGPLWDHYSCCGVIRIPLPRHLPLPADFWETARPGDTYQGAIDAMWATEEEQHGSQDEKHRRGARSTRKAAG